MDLGVNVYFNTLSGLDEENMVSIYIFVCVLVLCTQVNMMFVMLL